MYCILCRERREGPVGVICNYEMNTSFHCPHLPYRTEFAQFLTSPTPADTAELPYTVGNFDHPTALALAKFHRFPLYMGMSCSSQTLLCLVILMDTQLWLQGRSPYLSVSGDTQEETYLQEGWYCKSLASEWNYQHHNCGSQLQEYFPLPYPR